ncbi:hypothetical protein BD560DRAFT_394053 [Blakeslea trispora]|nr:hypothetical protein BD560DRAFT_394053 [Blakeslea trispora]
MRPSLTKSVVLTLLLLQCTQISYAQKDSGVNGLISDIVNGPQDTASAIVTSVKPTQEPASSSEPPPTTTQAAPTTTAIDTPPPATTTTPPPEQSKTKPQGVQTTAEDITTTTTTARGRKSQARPTETVSDNTATGTTKNTLDSPNPTSSSDVNHSSKSDNQSSDPPNKTAIVAGSVVGCLVGVALIGGILTWMNRRGGCTSRTRRRDASGNNDFEGGTDYKMTEDHVADNMHASNSPFQHARRFVPPTSGYMNLNDEEHTYHQNMNTANYQYAPEYNSSTVNPQNTQPEYYQQDYYPTGQPVPEYASPNTYQQPYYNSATGPNLTSPNVTNPVTVGSNYQQMKPDQIEQKPNAA